LERKREDIKLEVGRQVGVAPRIIIVLITGAIIIILRIIIIIITIYNLPRASFFNSGERQLGLPSRSPKELPAIQSIPKGLSGRKKEQFKKRREELRKRVLLWLDEEKLMSLPRGGRLKHFYRRWARTCGGKELVKFGIFANIKEDRKEEATAYFSEHKEKNEFHPRSKKEEEDYNKIVEDLIAAGTLVQTPEEEIEFYPQNHLVPKPGGKSRLVTDMRMINQFVNCKHFKMEGILTVRQSLRKGHYAITFDLKEAYNHVPVHKSFQKYLGFAHQGKTYTWRGMPFGLSDAPRVFSMIMKKVAQFIRETFHVNAVIYLDDLLLTHPNRRHLKSIGEEVALFLEALGLTVNREKSHLNPMRVFRYLGWVFDTSNMTLQLPEERKLKALDLVQKLKKSVHVGARLPVRVLAKVIGTLSATRIQMAPASLYLTQLNKLKCQGVQREGWNGYIRLNYSVMGELRKWTQFLKENKPMPIRIDVTPQLVITTDAAPSGWGATLHRMFYHSRICLSEKENPTFFFDPCQTPLRTAFGMWTKNMAESSSNKRELIAVDKALKAFYPTIQKLKSTSILIQTDNTTTMYNLNRQAAKITLYRSVRRLINWIKDHNLIVKASYVPGDNNQVPDQLSRLETAGDYRLKKAYLKPALRELQIKPDIDLFASKRNAQLNIFGSVSRPGRQVVPGPRGGPEIIQENIGNALLSDWRAMTPLIHPPIPLVTRSLQKFIRDGTKKGILVVPDWKGQSWSHLLKSLSVKKIILGSSTEVLQKGRLMRGRNRALPPGNIALHLLKAPRKPCSSETTKSYEIVTSRPLLTY
jgi:hypothetical protein